MNRQPLGSLDHNRYLFDDTQPSTTSFSKVSIMDTHKISGVRTMVSSHVAHQNAQVKMTLGMMGRQVNYQILTEQTESDEDEAAQRLLLVMIENQRLRLHIAKKEQQLQPYRLDIQSKDSSIKQLLQAIGQLRSANSKISSQLMSSNLQVNSLRESKQQLESETQSLKKQLNELKYTVEHSSTELKKQQQNYSTQLQNIQNRYVSKTREMASYYEQAIGKLEDDNVNLRFEISKLKSDLSKMVGLERQGKIDNARLEAILQSKEQQQAVELKKMQKKIAESEEERQRLGMLLAEYSNNKYQEQLESLRNKIKYLEEQHTSAIHLKDDRIRCLEQLVNKQKIQIDVEKEEHNKKVLQLVRQIQQLRTGIETDKNRECTTEIQMTKLKAENGSLKEELSEQYRCILMMESKMRAYENRIGILEKEREETNKRPLSHYLSSGVIYDRPYQRAATSIDKRDGKESREYSRDYSREYSRDALRHELKQEYRQEVTRQDATRHQMPRHEPLRLTTHEEIDVRLPHRNESLNDAIVRKCRVLRSRQ